MRSLKDLDTSEIVNPGTPSKPDAEDDDDVDDEAPDVDCLESDSSSSTEKPSIDSSPSMNNAFTTTCKKEAKKTKSMQRTNRTTKV